MTNKLSGWQDTIVALATPPGVGAIGVIRLSGDKAFGIINTLFSSKDLSGKPSHTIHVGLIKDKGKLIDEVVVSLFKGPKSYTGEDVVEISCHGSPYVQQQVLHACVNHGARMAKPGEYTQRAFLNGKLDLTQAEAVADLIASNTAASQKAALYNIRGGFSEVLKTLREELISFSALIELELDFSQEDVEFADRKKFYELIRSAKTTTTQLLNSFQLGNVIKNGVSVAIIGKPNAGKSTLLNTLLNENRAIVSEIAGTTRDTIEEVLNINGILFRLIDTAGIREHSTDSIELVGIERSLEKMKSADVVLYIFDVNQISAEELKVIADMLQQNNNTVILVGNKADIATTNEIKNKFSGINNIHFISAKNKTGIDELKGVIFKSTVHELPSSESVIVTNARHQQALQQVERSLNDIEAGLNNAIPGDLLALDIRRCLHYISEITGDISNEDVLDFIFSKFCIGK
ncbi:tRNA uridine-5-carboxymethylaminomethyl(34) synthesis GTPase MnmE [Ferruginibacter paludis]|uniref:tRNA uridine-5-carboxymethylaminomethyl(34) synthesis GTPase MnmE n=1 Tax=Ferruginibacter paludis TaxID=1310417 RepID=UPI0025B4487C|nr:tRNA uridine-5-carboxymethylaminomethyl(34) synthesis GTPase MnmE [Ferruginibacter paludis]MDN3654566.1 tRNA uridine-5-carboxymethylaminomethyl(34) synthesis GTPase MnmE [Ferruginibacter paludis]